MGRAMTSLVARSSRRYRALAGLLLGAGLLAGLASLATAAADTVATPGATRAGGDLFVAASEVTVDAPVAGDLFAVGGRIAVEAPVEGDVLMMGGQLRLRAAAARSVYAGGGQVELEGAVGRNLRVAGGQVTLARDARVAGNASVAGGQLRLFGAVDGQVQVAGGRVLIDGPVAGDVVAAAGALALGPNARIQGRLHYRSGDSLDLDPAAQVLGGIERLPMPPHGDERWDRDMPRPDDGPGIAGWLVGVLGWGLLAAVLLAVWPGVTAAVSDTLRGRAGRSLLLGFALLVCVPVAVLLLAITLVGLPLALLALAAYLALLPLGYVLTAIGLGDWALRRWRAGTAAGRGPRIAAACLAVLALAGLRALPFVGGAVALLAVLAGLGAIVLRATRPAPA